MPRSSRWAGRSRTKPAAATATGCRARTKTSRPSCDRGRPPPEPPAAAPLSRAPFSVALTGNVAAGKSSVARWLAEWGARLIDADAIVRELQQPGTPVFRALVDRFGPDILDPDGTLARDALRRLALGNRSVLEDLNAIVHPAVRSRQAALAAQAQSRGDPVVVHDIPLLFETGDPGRFDLVLLVDAPVPIRRDRLVRLRGLPPEEADRLIAAQAPSEPKRARSDLVIDNDRDLPTLRARTREAWEHIRRAAAARA